MRLWSRFVISISLLCPSVAQAVDAYTADADTPEQLGTVEVKARRSPTRIATGTSVQTLTQTTIADLGIQNMADAVRRFAGANVKDYGGIGGLKTVSVRNMGAAHTAVSYDGVPVTNCQGGQVDIGRFSLDNVSSLSLAVGQTDDLLQPARLYGSAAVLSIETQRPEFAPGQSSAFRLEMRGGSFGYVSPTARWWQRYGEKLTSSLDATFLRADGAYPFELRNGRLVTKEKRLNSAIDSWHTELNLRFTPDETQSLALKGYWSWSKRGLPGAVTLYNPYSTEKLWDRHAFLQLKYRKEFSNKVNFQAIAKYTNGYSKDRETGPEFAGGVYRDIHRQHEWYLSATATYTPVKGLQLALAQDGAINKLTSTVAATPSPRRVSSFTALSGRWRKGALTATATLVGTYITEHVSFGRRPDDRRRLAPTASVSIRPWRSEMLFVRAMYKSTFRVPTFNDMYYDRVGVRSLKPEKANEYSVGLTWSRRLFPAMDYLSVTADAYYNDVTDKIVAFPTTYTWRMINYGQVRIKGVDFTAATSFALPRSMHLAVTGAYTYQKALDYTDMKDKNYKAQLPYTPVHSGNVGVTLTTPWVTVGYSLVGVGMRYYMSQNIKANEIAGYVDQTLALSREFRLKHCTLGLRGEILNLADKQYDVIKYYPMPGRSWRLTGTLKF